MAGLSEKPRAGQLLMEGSGACGDLGTFIPHVIGAMTVAGLAPAGVLFGFAAFLIATGLFYGLPLPVQPMKAISAVILTGGLRPGGRRRRDISASCCSCSGLPAGSAGSREQFRSP